MASAGADVTPPAYGADAAKGCQSAPALVGQDFSCFYVFSNTQATAHDTDILIAAADSANRRPTPATGPTTNILPLLQLVASSVNGGTLPTCTGPGMTGNGTSASPYLGATSCAVPFGGVLTSAMFDLGQVTQADAEAHSIKDQITFAWQSACINTQGPCDPVTVNFAQAPAAVHTVAVSALTTDVIPTDGAVPLFIHDVAHLTGVTADAKGTITFQLYDITAIGGTTCTNTPIETDSVSVNGPGDYPSAPVLINKVASYGYVATYTPDNNNTAAGPTACGDPREHAILNKSQTGIDTTASAATPSNSLPATVTDTAQLTLAPGASGSIPVTGTITFHLYSDITCQHEVTPAGGVTTSVSGSLSSGGPLFFQSPPVTVSAAGTYYWRAGYSGDPNNSAAPLINNQPGLTDCNAPNESVKVNAQEVNLTTTASSATSLPATLTDTAHLVNPSPHPGSPTPGGTITFHLYSNANCTTEVSGSPVQVHVSGFADYTSPGVTVNGSGNYFWTASYSGDTNYAAQTTACGDDGETSQVGALGQLEICKSGDNGAAGAKFKFTITPLPGGTPQTVTVTGGTCTGAIKVLVGRVLVTEDLSSGLWTVSGIQVIPSLNDISDNLGGGSTKIKVTRSGETVVQFTDTPAPAVLKVCKYSSVPAIQGKQFSFRLLNTTLQATAGSSQGTAGCSTLLTVQPGSKFDITESVPSGEQVTKVTVGGSNTTLNSSSNGVANVTVGPGVNVVYFDNEVVPPAQNGFIEICKDAGDQFVAASTTPFVFTVTDVNKVQQTASVLPGQCSAALSVAAGPVNVAEAATDGDQVTAISAIPSSALGLTSLNNGTAVVVVPVSSTPTGEVEVHFTNSTLTTQVKVCKFLGPNSGDLAGQTFTFTVTDDAFPAGTSFKVPVVATAAANGACVIVTQTVKGVTSQVPFPIGSTVTVTEPAQAFVNGDNSGVNQVDTQTQTVTSGINSVTFTNQAYGQFEVCKNMSDSPGSVYHGLPFTFSYKGVDFPKVTGSFTVGVDACSQPQVVPVGSYTITEQPVLGFGLQSVTASRLNSPVPVTTNGNSATISVPFLSNPFPNGGEVDVTFTNAPQTANVKVCKQIDPNSTAALGNSTFTFTLKNLNTMASTTSDPVSPNTCFQFNNVPIVDASGNAIPYQVQETLNPAKYVPTGIDSSGSSNIDVNGTPNNNNNGRIRFTFTGPGNAVFIYTNASP